MSVLNLTGGRSRGHVVDEDLRDVSIVTLGGNLTLTPKSPPLQFIDPNGARTLTLPAEADSKGLTFLIHNNAGGAEIITIKDDAAATIATPTQNEMALVYCDGVSWHGVVVATES